MQPIPYALLIDLAEGRMNHTEAAALRARVAANPAAASQLQAIEALIDLMRTDDSVDVSEPVMNRALRLVERPLAPSNPNPLRQLIAVLKSDNWKTPGLAAGFRSVQAWPRVLLLSAGDRELDLQIRPRGERWFLQGQVLGPEEPGTVALHRDNERITALLNELGEFVLPPVAAGRYTLTVTQGELEIIVPELELGPSLNKN